MAKNLIISGIVEKKRHSFRVSVSDSLYKAIKNHAVERNFTTAGAAEEMLEKSVLNLPIIYDLHADEETNTVNNIKYYLEEIKKDVKYSVLMVHDESYSHAAEDFISFLEPLSSNPMSCFNSCNLAIIEKEYMNILLAAYSAGLRAGISVFPLEESYFYRFLHLCRRGDGIKNNNFSESVQKGTLYRYGFDRHNTANKICAVLKYLSLTHPNLQMPELRGIFEQNFAANLLTEIILNSCWYKDSVTIKSELSFFSKDDYTHTFNKFLTLYDELSEYIKKANVNFTIENFSSNYDGGYYGEIYDNANYKSIVV